MYCQFHLSRDSSATKDSPEIFLGLQFANLKERYINLLVSLHRIINKEFYLNEYLQILAVICVTQTPNPSRARAPEPLSDVSHDSDIIQEGDKHKQALRRFL